MRLPRGRLPERIGTFDGFVADAPIQVFRLCAFPRRNELGPPDGSRDYFQAIDQRHDPPGHCGCAANSANGANFPSIARRGTGKNDPLVLVQCRPRARPPRLRTLGLGRGTLKSDSKIRRAFGLDGCYSPPHASSRRHSDLYSRTGFRLGSSCLRCRVRTYP